MGSTYTLITGANGEIGHGLVDEIASDDKSDTRVIAVDLHPLHPKLAARCSHEIQGDITDPKVVAQLEHFPITEIYHLAALLSSGAEKFPERAHYVNVDGTLGLLEMARRIGKREQTAVRFLFPSSIAVYGIDSLEQKDAAGAVAENAWNTPVTMYGINKLYCEQLGNYYSRHYMRLAESRESGYVDFRALRFPGLISAFTVPSGGTSDYASEMIHAAAQGKPYQCFVRESTRIPFMAMPDAIRALRELAAAPGESLTRAAYNIGAFAPSAAEFQAKVQREFPAAELSYEPHVKRQAIVDTWPAQVDDSAAARDWQWRAELDFDTTFHEYLMPNIIRHYHLANEA